MLIKTNKQFFNFDNCLKIKTLHSYFYIRQLNWLLWSLLFIVIGVFLLPQIAYFSDITSQNLIELTNQERIKAGTAVLTANQLLAKAAYLKGQDILETQTFQHNIADKKFSNWIKEAGYSYSYVGENLAIDFVTSKGIVKAWLNSPTHKKNLLNSYFSEIGIATIEGKFQGKNTTLVVQIFGAPPRSIVELPIKNNILNYAMLPTNGLEKENLLTHTITSTQNPNQISRIGNKFILDQEVLGVSKKMNKFFAQYMYLVTAMSYFITAISILLVLTIIYLYFYFFSRLSKQVHSA